MSKSIILLICFTLFTISTNKESNDEFEEVLAYVKTTIQDSISIRNLDVFGWDLVWNHDLIQSVSTYLFEDLSITENIAPKGNPNRPGDKHEKVYICVHDTGDATLSAKEWSEVVYNAELDGNPYEASYQYVVGNDGVYHNIPDDETAYHAGDGASEASWFKEYPTGVFQDKKVNDPHIGISNDGFYTIEGEKTVNKAPTGDKGEILSEEDINDLGIYLTVKEEKEGNQYYIGKTWWSSTYEKISNKGGNTNSIGIESCVNNGSDLHLTWQRLAKLVAKLMDTNNIPRNRVVQHHFFSGKDCPMTMRKAKLWNYFLALVSTEYQMLQYEKLGYKFRLISSDENYVNNKGRVIKRNQDIKQSVTFTVEVTNKEGEIREQSFITIIPPINIKF